MKGLTTFHLLEKTFVAVFASGMRDIIVARRNDTNVGDTVRLVSDDIGCAVECEVRDVTFHEKHSDVMTITISDYREIDYAICD